MANGYPSDSTTDAPPPKRKGPQKGHRNMRTASANQMQYLLENYPADITHFPLGNEKAYWSEEQVLKAMQAAFNAGKRARKRGD